MGKAIGYMLGQWSNLEAYTRDGRLEIDNPAAIFLGSEKNAIRPLHLAERTISSPASLADKAPNARR